MVTFAQAQERAEEWINGDVPAYLHREVRVREFGLGFVVWAEDREEAPTPDAGRQRLVIARDSGEATLWPGLPVGEVIRRYEEEYGVVAEPAASVPAQASARIDLNQTSFLLSPPEWLQEAADKIGLPPVASNASQASAGASSASSEASEASASVASPVSSESGEFPGSEAAGAPEVPVSAEEHSVPAPLPVPVPAPLPVPESAPLPVPESAPAPEASPAPAPVAAQAPPVPSAPAPAPVDASAADPVPAPAPSSSSPWADANASAGGADGAVPLPATVFAPPLSGADDEDAPPPVVGADAPTALMKGGSALPATAIAPRLNTDAPFQQGGPAVPPGPPSPPPGPPAPQPSAPPVPPGTPGAANLADAATDKAPPGATPPPAVHHAATMLAHPNQGGPGAPPPPPPPPGMPGAPGTPPGGVAHAATMLAHPNQGGPGAPPPPPPPPGVPGAPGTPPGGVAHAATMLAHPNQGGPGAPPPPPPPPGVPGAPGTPPGGIAHAATMLAQPGPSGLAGPPPPPGPVPAPMNAPVPPPAYGYPQQPPAGLPTVGPGYQAVLRYRAPDGSEQQIIRRSAPGTPHPEWQILHELRAMNVPPQQVLELHTELESCELPGGYCARMIRETWPQARITNIAPYGRDHAGRQQGMQQLITHQGELHQVADGPARPAPVRAPLPQVQPAPPLPPDGVAQELAGAFGPGILRFDQRAVSRQGVPELVAVTLVWAGLPADFGPFFWAQPAMPVVPTLAELAAQRQVQPAADAGSYLVLGSDFGRAICVQYGTAHIVAVPVEAGPGGQPVPPQFVNTGLPEFVRCLALLGRMWRLRFGLNPEQAGRWTADFQAQLAMLDPAALSSPENWWSVLLEQMWDGLL
ncbi:SUKH-4 family immunity protein [Streptomyces sp. NPDC046385]|uniref:SUKH-4 family immunity protein n=1 Tax=Streptomyces sp. NPDC046385 TaxID=3154918 RepID=UPI0033C523B9